MRSLVQVAESYAKINKLTGRGPSTLVERARRWERSGAKTAHEFRTDKGKDYEAATIESTISAVARLFKFCNRDFEIGQRLRLPPPRPQPAEIEEVGKLYASVRAAKWPSRLSDEDREKWWQGYVLLSYWTAFRLSDIESLCWEQIGNAIAKPASKTGKEHRIPIVSTVRRHLDQLPRCEGPTLFGFTSCRRQFRRELRRICLAAGLRNLTPQNFRQASVAAWSKADLAAGPIIQGTALKGSIGHYITAEVLLTQVADRVPFPAQMLTAEEQADQQSGESELLNRFRSATADQRQMLLQMSRLTG